MDTTRRAGSSRDACLRLPGQLGANPIGTGTLENCCHPAPQRTALDELACQRFNLCVGGSRRHDLDLGVALEHEQLTDT